MSGTKPESQTGKGKGQREDRLKAALKANLQRRKAQAKARDGSSGSEANKETG